MNESTQNKRQSDRSKLNAVIPVNGINDLFRPLIKKVLGVTKGNDHYFMARLTDGRLVRIEAPEDPRDRPHLGDVYFEPRAQKTA